MSVYFVCVVVFIYEIFKRSVYNIITVLEMYKTRSETVRKKCIAYVIKSGPNSFTNLHKKNLCASALQKNLGNHHGSLLSSI